MKVMLCGKTLEETLQIASDKLGDDVLELRTPKGATIDSISLLRYGLVLSSAG